MHERFLESRGICYRTNHFLPDRPTLLLVHGFSASASGWKEFEERWEYEFNLLIPDLRGHGNSKRYGSYRDYSISEHASDMAVLLDTLGVRECTVVGYSFGVDIALNLYLLRKQLVKKTVLVGPIYKLASLWRIRLGEPFIWGLAMASNLLPAATALPGRVNYARFKDAGDESPGRIVSDLVHTGPRAYFNSLRQIIGYPCDARWRDLRTPTLILRGANDTFTPYRYIETLADTIPHSELQIIADGGHMLPYHNASQVAQAIEKFVAQ